MTVRYVLCSASGWGSAFPVLTHVGEEKTRGEVQFENDMARQLQLSRYWITLDEALRRFPNNSDVQHAAWKPNVGKVMG
jgi:hypothetical protein